MPRPSAPILAFCNPKGMPAMPSTPDSTTGLGSRLRQLRAQRAMTQQDLAGQVGIHYTHIGRYEANKSLPAADTLKRIAQALGTTTDYLMDGNTQDAAKSRLTDKALLQRFEVSAHPSRSPSRRIPESVTAENSGCRKLDEARRGSGGA